MGDEAVDLYLEICYWHNKKMAVFADSGENGKGSTLLHYLETKNYVVTSEVNETELRVIPIIDIK